MSWYIHTSKQLREDELPPELVVTNRNGSIEQAYVPYNASDQLEAENARLRELLAELVSTTILCQNGECNNCQFGNPTGFGCTWDNYIRELGIEV